MYVPLYIQCYSFKRNHIITSENIPASFVANNGSRNIRSEDRTQYIQLYTPWCYFLNIILLQIKGDMNTSTTQEFLNSSYSVWAVHVYYACFQNWSLLDIARSVHQINCKFNHFWKQCNQTTTFFGCPSRKMPFCGLNWCRRKRLNPI